MFFGVNTCSYLKKKKIVYVGVGTNVIFEKKIIDLHWLPKLVIILKKKSQTLEKMKILKQKRGGEEEIKEEIRR